MKIASISEAKNGLSALLDLVRAGEAVIIADRGTPVARLEAVPSSEGGGAVGRLERSGLVRRGTGNAVDALALAAQPLPDVAAGHERAGLEALAEERREGR